MHRTTKYEHLILLMNRLNEAAQSALPAGGQGCHPGCLYCFDPLLDRTDAWAYTGFKPGTLATWDCNKTYDLQPIKFGNAVRYRLSSLNRFAEARQRPF